MRLNQILDDIYQLRVEIHVVGYPEKGESQIIFIKEGDTILFSCTVDCYAVDNTNKTLEILKDNNIKSLDYFIWTHTDEDHSVGINEIIDDCCSNKTEYILPEGVNGNERDFIDYNQNIKFVFDKINNSNSGRNYTVNTASACKGGHSRLCYRTFSDKATSKSVEFEIIAVAPISSVVRRRWADGHAKKKNDLSIATIFKIGELAILLSGDIEDQSIRLIPNYYFGNLSYIKTPHHTSNTSTSLLDKIGEVFNGNKIPSAVSTVYKVHDLPDVGLIRKYAKYTSKFMSTGSGSANYGYIKTVFDVINKEIISEELEGNAHIC